MPKITLKGFDELERNLKRLSNVAAGKVLTKGVRAGMSVIRKDMRNRVPNLEHAGVQLHREIKTRISKRERFGIRGVIFVSKKAWWARFREFGTAAHSIRVKDSNVLAGEGKVFGTEVTHPGVRQQPFFRPAFDERGPAAMAAMGRKIWSELRRLAVVK